MALKKPTHSMLRTISAGRLFRSGNGNKVSRRRVSAIIGLFDASAIGLPFDTDNGYSNLTGKKRIES